MQVTKELISEPPTATQHRRYPRGKSRPRKLIFYIASLNPYSPAALCQALPQVHLKSVDRYSLGPSIRCFPPRALRVFRPVFITSTNGRTPCLHSTKFRPVPVPQPTPAPPPVQPVRNFEHCASRGALPCWQQLKAQFVRNTLARRT